VVRFQIGGLQLKRKILTVLVAALAAFQETAASVNGYRGIFVLAPTK
jgi:hypothetical protein